MVKEIVKMKVIDLVTKVDQALRELLLKAGVSLTDFAINESPSSYGDRFRPDLELEARPPNGSSYRILVEIKGQMQPQTTRLAILQLRNAIGRKKAQYGVLAAPYLSPDSAAICRQSGVGFLDLAGNCLLQFGGIYIEVSGRPNPYTEKRPLKSVFSRSSSRALRRLFLEPKRAWSLADLAQTSDVSLGQVFKLKTALVAQEFLREVQEEKRIRYRLRNPKSLLVKWSENYSYQKNKITNFYAMADVAEIENRLAAMCRQEGIRYAFSLTSGAIRVAPYLPYTRAFAYIDGPLSRLPDALGWKPVDSGANLSILQPYDEGVFAGLQDVNGEAVVSDLQLVLDLQSYPQRGQEAADWIQRTRLEPKW